MIYVVAPYGVAGGIEALYQLAAKLGEHARMLLVGQEADCSRYDHYNVQKIVSYQLNDTENDTAVIPEIYAGSIGFKKARTLVWWFSDEYMPARYIFSHQPEALHLSHSMTSTMYLYERGARNVYQLGDYINTEVFRRNGGERKDAILYNALKRPDINNTLKGLTPDYEWIPAVAKNETEMAELMNKCKVYLEVCHAGMGRMAREAVNCGCCVVAWNRGAGKYYHDTPFHGDYCADLTRPDRTIPVIKEIITNYDTHVKNFDRYRNLIAIQEQEMELRIRALFNAEDLCR